MKRGLILTFIIIVLVAFLGFGTYRWYEFFLNVTNNYGTGSATGNVTNNGITLINSQEKVYETDASKVDDEDVNSVTPYTFQVKNSKTTEGKYTLYLEDAPLNAINDGCTEATLLSRDDLKFQLKLNGKVLKEGLLSSIKDNILDVQTIKPNKTNNYQLRIFIHSEATNWTNKHYHYQVNIRVN